MRDILITLGETESDIAFYPEKVTVAPGTQINFVIGNGLFNYINDSNIYVIFSWNDSLQRIENHSSLTFSAGPTDTTDNYELFLINPYDANGSSNHDLKDIITNYESITSENGEIIVRD